jgi:hypothetical protein
MALLYKRAMLAIRSICIPIRDAAGLGGSRRQDLNGLSLSRPADPTRRDIAICLPRRRFSLGTLRDPAFEMTMLVIVYERAERRLVELVQHVLQLRGFRLADGELRTV